MSRGQRFKRGGIPFPGGHPIGGGFPLLAGRIQRNQRFRGRGIQRGQRPFWHTTLQAKSSVLYLWIPLEAERGCAGETQRLSDYSRAEDTVGWVPAVSSARSEASNRSECGDRTPGDPKVYKPAAAPFSPFPLSRHFPPHPAQGGCLFVLRQTLRGHEMLRRFPDRMFASVLKAESVE